MRVVFDLDGVLRDLSGHIAHMYGEPYPKVWNVKFKGKSIYECINEHPEILLEAPPTGYLDVVKEFYPAPEIWTSQPVAYQENTATWIKKHIHPDCMLHFYNPEEKARGVKEDEDILLFEDSPNFKDYTNIALIDRPYNQEVKAVRIFGKRHLKNILENIKEL